MMGKEYGDTIGPTDQDEYDRILLEQRQLHQLQSDKLKCGLDYYAPLDRKVASELEKKEETKRFRRMKSINDGHIEQVKIDFDYIYKSLKFVCDDE